MTTATTQKVLYLTEKQGDFAVGQTDIPTPGVAEVLIHAQSIALNPLEWKIQTYGIFIETYPTILGCDTAGTVVAVGNGVTNLSVGDRVLYEGQVASPSAAYQQYSVADASLAAKIPPNISFDEAATLPACYATAAFGLYGPKWERGGAELIAPWVASGRGKYAGKPIIVFGGASSVGQFVIQLAKLSGFSPIFATSSPRNFELVKSLGATHPLDRNISAQEIAEAFRAITNEPLKIVYDAVGDVEAIQNIAYDLLAPGGKIVSVLDDLVAKEKVTPDKEVIRTYGSPHPPPNKELGKALFATLTDLLSSGDIKPLPVDYAAGGLGSIPAQLQRLKNNEISGKKIVVRPPETA